ncbi:MAG TPA: hypothetical protein VMW19_13670 [Myxococcota bacterium]|nr:hypothetical protein [Myxococcota bacterium]
MRLRTLMVAALALACSALSPAARAADAPASPAPQQQPKESASEVAEEFSDPLTTLPQIFVNDAYTPDSYGTHANTNRLTARVIVPRVPESSLLPFVQLIRPSLQVVTAPTGTRSQTRTSLGDFQLFDLAYLPWPGRESGLFMGVGPLFVFPTATHREAGQGSWQAGPAFAAIYKGIPGLLIGTLVQNPISFAEVARDRKSVDTLLVQPIVLAYLGKGFYLKSADATWSRGWNQNQSTLLPISFGIGHVTVREGWPPVNVFASGEYMAWRDDAPVAPQWTARVGVTVAFPEWKPW